MKTDKELLDLVREENRYTQLSREITLKWHEKVRIPKHKKIKDKKEREQKLEADNSMVKNLKILISDTQEIDGIIEEEIKSLK